MIDLLIYKKRALIILIEFTEPVPIKTAFLLKMNIHKLSEGQ
jgi:hypothetical protein